MSEESWLIQPPSNDTIQGTNAQDTKKQSHKNANTFANLMAAQHKRANTQGVLPQSGRNLVLAGRTPSDFMRMQMLAAPNTANAKNAALQGSTLELARSMSESRHIHAIAGTEGFINRGLSTNGLGDFIRGQSKDKIKRRKKMQKGLAAKTGIGKLSAQFESGEDGIAAIGYDGTGGTSYGKYQIASKVGTMTDFLKFLDREAPDLSKRLRTSGPANTGSRKGAMPDMWKTIAQEDPSRFESLQEAFAAESHYRPALNSIVKNTGLEEDTLSQAMREVIWSTAIQHGAGGASKIFIRADSMSGDANSPNYERNMINNVYKIRAGQFGSSTEAVRAAVQNRFKKEKVLALNMLEESLSTSA